MINIYIVTYRSPVDLNNNIASILASNADVSINVINNHSDFFLEPEHEKVVKIFHNSLRPDFSTGHLSRNWNQALLHGFQNLKNPTSDIVITVQDDVIFKPDWFSRLVDLHHQYSFITMGMGDTFCSYLPEAVRKIGLWDERFCNIGYHAADYLLRALIYNREESSINDVAHGRLHNAVEGNVVSHGHLLNSDSGNGASRADSILITSPPADTARQEAHILSMKFHSLTNKIFMHKWGISPFNWTEDHHALRKTLIPNYITYPYFEKDIENLRDKNYVIPDEY